MRQFLIFASIYLCLGVALVFLVRENPATLLAFVYLKTMNLAGSLLVYAKYLGIFVIIGLFLTRHLGIANRVVPMIYAILGCMLFSSAFSLWKTTIPYVVPFYADEMLADLDAWMHFGVDPWILVHQFSDMIPANTVVTLYFWMWTLPAIFLPVIIATTDTDPDRTKRFLILHVICWIGLGNVVAAMFSSVGPVYYDRLLGGVRFADLNLALETSGMSATKLGIVQEGLWKQYVENSQTIGSGISAFPSVHVGVSAVFALYIYERSRLLAPFAILFLIAICFCSVYNGWHYAVDGYVSIALIYAAWAALRRRNVAFAPMAPA
ncbi:MAG: phosphatase PAP2 family protein [Pseudomonadota bacterium]